MSRCSDLNTTPWSRCFRAGARPTWLGNPSVVKVMTGSGMTFDSAFSPRLKIAPVTKVLKSASTEGSRFQEAAARRILRSILDVRSQETSSSDFYGGVDDLRTGFSAIPVKRLPKIRCGC